MSCNCRYVSGQKAKLLPAGSILHQSNRQYVLLRDTPSDIAYSSTVPAVEVYVTSSGVRSFTPAPGLRVSWQKYRKGDVLAGEFSYWCDVQKPH